MGRVKIATDSTADVPAALASELDITVIPCQVFWGQEVYRDGIDLDPWSFYDRLAASAELPRTSQPPVHLFVEAYRRLLDGKECDAIVSIHVPGNVSGTVNAAWTAAQTLDEPSRVEVIDSGQISMGMGLAVIQAARMAQAGAGQAEIGQAVRKLLPNLRAAAMIDNLDNLYRGGRITQVAATLGTVLQIKPLIRVREGQIDVVEKVRTRSRALERLNALVRSWGPLAEMVVLHAGVEPLAQDLFSRLQDLVPGAQMAPQPAGAALVTHLGLGAVGVCALQAVEGR